MTDPLLPLSLRKFVGVTLGVILGVELRGLAICRVTFTWYRVHVTYHVTSPWLCGRLISRVTSPAWRAPVLYPQCRVHGTFPWLRAPVVFC